MSIPLDRLYNFLHDLCNHDIIIYRWLPHGSKKLADLAPLSNRHFNNWFTSMTTPIAIMHDQEPLYFNYWSTDEIAQHWASKNQNWSPDSTRIDYQGTLHLRSAASPSCSNVYDYTIVVHSEQNSQEVAKYQQHGFLPVYYWSHAIIAADWFRYAAHDPLLEFDTKNIKYDFLIYNRAWSGTREYRLTFAEMLARNNLIKKCLTTFSPHDNGQYYIDHTFENDTLRINSVDLHELFDTNQHSSHASADYNSQDYQTSAIEIVLETLFDDTRWHLTEKILRPIACGKPFILASTAGSLKYLQSYGFETFNNYINEEYDSIECPHERLLAIVREMQRISSLPLEQKKELWKQLNAIAKRNQILFHSKTWQDNIAQEFYKNINDAMDTMQLNCTGKYWKKLRTLFEPNSQSSAAIQDINDWLKKHN